MSKRGVTKPFKVEFEWTPSGITGVVPYSSFDEAEMKAAEIRRNGENHPEQDVTVEVKYRPAGSVRRVRQ